MQRQSSSERLVPSFARLYQRFRVTTSSLAHNRKEEIRVELTRDKHDSLSRLKFVLIRYHFIALSNRVNLSRQSRERVIIEEPEGKNTC